MQTVGQDGYLYPEGGRYMLTAHQLAQLPERCMLRVDSDYPEYYVKYLGKFHLACVNGYVYPVGQPAGYMRRFVFRRFDGSDERAACQWLRQFEEVQQHG